MNKSIGNLTLKLDVNTVEFQKLVAICLEQTTLINELHEKVYDNPVLDAKVEDMFESINTMELDDYLNKIKADAVQNARSNCEVYWFENIGESVIVTDDLDEEIYKLSEVIYD